MSSDRDVLRALIREVIRDVLPPGGPIAETVNLSTDNDLAAFVTRLLELGPDEREELRSGRKRFRLATPATPATQPVTGGHPAGHPGGTGHAPAAAAGIRRVERGAVTERVIAAAAQAGERLVLGPGAVLTPLARDRARASGVRIEKER